MLDQTTKKSIDSARDVLVGKVPDPKAQVDQITTALIYKFMDDMDRENEELGRKATFLVDDLNEFTWAKLMSRELAGIERDDLYRRAIATFEKSKQVPELFRQIFKGGYLPYRDPETLNLFLKEISNFSYDQSEKLGDAFEYLLSVLGSQGDAGQFRTPRHIIDFIVEAVDPKKNERILDPACGTAGFLISAYKHIIKTNSSNYKKDNKQNVIHEGSTAQETVVENTEKFTGDLLSPDERKTLMQSIEGYDISPDMVKISLVNMYLHGFQTPKIHEYDSLSYEDRWNDDFDVILANPPFMSPKGGIRPHKRFQIQANRSELLFVDYILEHLSIHGRAGIIVPEGIIFQSSNAYKELRKMLVDDNYLYAVVSLPAGVFNPYTGVKTSILLIDKDTAKKKDEILFVKVSNDGFDLGAQRRKISKNDLSDALEIIHSFCHSGFDPDSSIIAHSVPKTKIAEAGDYNLSGDRYRVKTDYSDAKWPIIELGEIVDLVRGATYSKTDEVKKDGNKILRANNISLDNNLVLEDVKLISKKVNLSKEKRLKQNDIFICLASGSKTHIGKTAFIGEDTDFYFGGFMGAIRIKDCDMADPRYVFHLLKSTDFNEYLGQAVSGANINNLNSGILGRYKIPLPPLEIQEQIVVELDGYQKIIDGAKQIVSSWKSKIDIDPEWEKVKLRDVCERLTDGSHFSPETTDSGLPYITVRDIDNDGKIDLLNSKKISKSAYEELVKNGCKPEHGDVLFSKDGTVGKVALVDFDDDFVVLSSLAILSFNENIVVPEYIYYVLQVPEIVANALGMMKGVAIRRVILKDLKNLEIPFPPPAIQKQIVEKIKTERALVNSAKKLIEIYEQKIKDKIAGIWG